MKTRKIYIAGPMTGLPGFNYAAFDKAAAKLRAEGIWEVVSPAEIGNRYGDPEAINADPKLLAAVVAAETHALAECEAIYLLPCWNKSAGARRELAQAIENGAEIVWEETAPKYDTNLVEFILSMENETLNKWRIAKEKFERKDEALKIAENERNKASDELEELRKQIIATIKYLKWGHKDLGEFDEVYVENT